MTLQCNQCGAEILTTSESQRYRYRKTGKIFCTKACGMASRPKAAPRARTASALCSVCGKDVQVSGWTLKRWEGVGRAYCGTACSSAYRAQVSSITMAETNRKHCSERMRRKNPMNSPESIAKMRATLLAMGHRPKVRGGNGQPATAAEQALFDVLSPLGFTNQFIVPCGAGRKAGGYPTHYKIDCANPHLMIAIEADGASHGMTSRQQQGAKKDAFLRGLGWKVLRLSNQTILRDTAAVVGMVTSIT